jgi:hypothetical protein
MSYQISYHNLENYIKFYMLRLIIKNKDNLNKIKVSILSKLLTSICTYEFSERLLYKMFFSPNESTSNIDKKKFTNYKMKFFNSINLLLTKQNFGIYLLKYYYIVFSTFYSYHKSIKYLCIKIFNKSKISSNQKILRLLTNMKIIDSNSNLIELNNFITKLEYKSKLSSNDDINYNIINDIAKLYSNNLKKLHILNIHNYVVFLDDNNIILSFLKNIYHLKKNIKYIK